MCILRFTAGFEVSACRSCIVKTNIPSHLLASPGVLLCSHRLGEVYSGPMLDFYFACYHNSVVWKYEKCWFVISARVFDVLCFCL